MWRFSLIWYFLMLVAVASPAMAFTCDNQIQMTGAESVIGLALKMGSIKAAVDSTGPILLIKDAVWKGMAPDDRFHFLQVFQCAVMGPHTYFPRLELRDLETNAHLATWENNMFTNEATNEK